MKKAEKKMEDGRSHRCQDGHHAKESYPRGTTIPAWTCAGFAGSKPCVCPCHQGKQMTEAN
jgi:hypothetical protein